MYINDHIVYSKKALDDGQDKFNACDFDEAISLFAAAYAEVRQLIDHVGRTKDKAISDKHPPGENIQ